MSPSLPNSCGYGGPPADSNLQVRRDQGRQVHGQGHGEIRYTGAVIETAKVTGTFLAKGKEKGKIKATLPNAQSCSGSFSYSTKAGKRG